MAIEDKVIQATPISKRVNQLNDIDFTALDENGYFLVFNGRKVVEFENITDPTNYAIELNSACLPIRTAIKQQFRQRIQDILDA